MEDLFQTVIKSVRCGADRVATSVAIT